MAAPSLVAQTIYAELLERSANAAFDETFAAEGAFTVKTIKGRRYWYFQVGVGGARKQQYVGAETPELLQRIASHRGARNDARERRALVSTLTRSFNMPRPLPQIGDVVAALAKAGVFRLRGVLVGTVAYQTYSAMLGVRLANALLETGDVDIAQFKNVSLAVGDNTSSALEILRGVDKTFRAIPHMVDGRRMTNYAARGGLRVDFLTPNEGGDTGTPQSLPALQTHAQPLRFLDFLIHDPEPAVLLHDVGIFVQVPAPARYAVHKLIVSSRRRDGVVKRDKDIRQASILLDALAEKRPHELRFAWEEAYGRGPTWRKLILQGLSLVSASARDLALKTTDLRRMVVPGLDLTFASPPVRYDFTRDIVTFDGEALGSPVSCAISREALDDHFGTDGLDQKGRIECVLRNRSRIESMFQIKYRSWPIEEPGTVLIRTEDIPALLKELSASKSVNRSGRTTRGRQADVK
jgi:hypothetical protein